MHTPNVYRLAKTKNTHSLFYQPKKIENHLVYIINLLIFAVKKVRSIAGTSDFSLFKI